MDAEIVEAMLLEVRLAERDRITRRLEAELAQMIWLSEDARRRLIACCGEGQK